MSEDKAPHQPAADREIKRKNRRKALCEAYRSSNQIDLVLGAGVSKATGIPLYLEMSLRLAKRASDKKLFPDAPPDAVTFLEEQLECLEREGPEKVAALIQPEEVMLFVKTYLPGDGATTLQNLAKETLYDEGKTVKIAARRLVSRQTYRGNATLDSIIRFCAALRGSVLAPTSKYKIQPNPKVHAILTTNYDNLLEAAFSTKFRYLLKPVGRTGSRESRTGQRLIPVYHIHGYISVFPPRDATKKQKPSELVIAEDDYFRTFYNPHGFTDSIATRFFRQRSCLFIGSAMTDMNLRRFLFYARREHTDPDTMPRHFAIMKTTTDPRDDFIASVLGAYGVDIIWIDDFVEIDEVLKEVYTSVEGIDPADWEALRKIERSGY